MWKNGKEGEHRGETNHGRNRGETGGGGSGGTGKKRREGSGRNVVRKTEWEETEWEETK